ncbi:hypothetical protein PV797_10905 [Clostridiaceae bacterium M8S5]|nr:hypothetical protein PV797_10905 [Clostridiaceae bacterium M8S5]
MKNIIKVPKLNYSSRSREFNLYTERQRNKCVYTYLFESRSHRWMDKNILSLDDIKSKGYQSMGILHRL